jgi:hypothetical protein
VSRGGALGSGARWRSSFRGGPPAAARFAALRPSLSPAPSPHRLTHLHCSTARSSSSLPTPGGPLYRSRIATEERVAAARMSSRAGGPFPGRRRLEQAAPERLQVDSPARHHPPPFGAPRRRRRWRHLLLFAAPTFSPSVGAEYGPDTNQ